MAGRSRTEDTYLALREALLDGKLPAGVRLRIDLLSDRYGVSPGAVREALARLTSDGLVQSEPQRGFLSAPISRLDLSELSQVRANIEAQCLACALTGADAAWEARVMRAWGELSGTRMLDKRRRAPLNPRWAERHRAFHQALVSSCGNSWWLRLRSHLDLQAERYRRRQMPDAATEARNRREHDALAHAALDRDTDAATRLVVEHFLAGAAELARSLPEGDARRTAAPGRPG